MLEYLLILPLVIFALLFATVYCRSTKNKKKATTFILLFIILLVVQNVDTGIDTNLNRNNCNKQQISQKSKNSLKYYLNTFNLSYIGRPFPCPARQYKLSKLRHTDNMKIIKNLYLKINKDNKISYSEVHELSIKTMFLYNLEKERAVANH